MKLAIDVARGDVRRDGNTVQISDGTRQLLVLLAFAEQPMQRDAVIDELWPDMDGDRAISALKVCIHRARLQLNDACVIVVSLGSIGLGDHVANNCTEIFELAAGRSHVTGRIRQQLADTLEALIAGLASHRAHWTWFDPHRQRLIHAMHAIGRRLIDYEVAGKRYSEALQIATSIESVDPFDSTAQAMTQSIYGRIRGD